MVTSGRIRLYLDPFLVHCFGYNFTTHPFLLQMYAQWTDMLLLQGLLYAGLEVTSDWRAAVHVKLERLSFFVAFLVHL